MEDNIFKIWGKRLRILLTSETEIDLLYLKKDSFCSTHSHKNKANKFVVVEGKVRIDTEFDSITLTKNQGFTVNPPLTHRFFALEDSIMIELAFVNEGKINPEDIIRTSQGGRVINGQEVTEDTMRDKGLLNL